MPGSGKSLPAEYKSVTLQSYPRLMSLWHDDPSHPGRMLITDPRVLDLIETLAPGSKATDLGGSMNLNVKLDPSGVVLRVHQPFVSRRRLLGLQAMKDVLARRGLSVATAIEHESATVFRCGDRWAEVEPFIHCSQPDPSPESYVWLFKSIGRLDRELSLLDLHVPTPLVSTYATPTTLMRWLPIAESGFIGDSDALDTLARIRRLVNRLKSHWVLARQLPRQLIHGDARLGNVRLSDGKDPVFLDFGFAAYRSRIHEVAYSLAYMILALDGHRDPASFDWGLVPVMLDVYEMSSGQSLSAMERRSLAPHMAAVPLYHAVSSGFLRRPKPALQSALPFVALSEWLIANPDASPI